MLSNESPLVWDASNVCGRILLCCYEPKESTVVLQTRLSGAVVWCRLISRLHPVSRVSYLEKCRRSICHSVGLSCSRCCCFYVSTLEPSVFTIRYPPARPSNPAPRRKEEALTAPEYRKEQGERHVGALVLFFHEDPRYVAIDQGATFLTQCL